MHLTAEPDDRRDGGFTLIEVLVSVGLIGVVMTALTTFFIKTIAVTGEQRSRQAAIQLAEDATDRVRAMEGAGIVQGRDKNTAEDQWANPIDAVAPYLADTQVTSDGTAASPAGHTAPLPTRPTTVTVNGIAYAQHWYVGTCWQRAAGGACGLARTADDVEFLRVVVAVTWPDPNCTSGTCAYVTSTLVNGGSLEPVFNENDSAPPPVPIDPGNQVGAVSHPQTLAMAAANGVPPLAWTATGLPPGLTMSPAGQIDGTPTTAGTYRVTAEVTDWFDHSGSVEFTWTVNAPPQLTHPGDQISPVGTALSLSIAHTGGTAPFSYSASGGWSATGLPPGLAIDASTGTISGTPTTAGSAKRVTVTVGDRFGESSSVSFDWRISLGVAQPGTQSGRVGDDVSRQLTVSGGTAPYTWSATDLPPGLAIDDHGLITGTPTAGTRYVVKATATDATGNTGVVTFVWDVAVRSGLPHVMHPTTDRTDDEVGQPISITARATGGNQETWTATGLPPGISISSDGVLTGTLTTAGTYTTTLTVRDRSGATATFMFTWSVR